MENNQTKDKWWEKPWLMLVLFVMIFFVWAGSWLWAERWAGWKLISTDQHLSNLGDWFSAISALFAGWAFAALIYTIILQRSELRQTREEFRLQREELSVQSKTFHQQTFENTLFQMIDVWRKMINEIENAHTKTSYKTDYFATMAARFNSIRKDHNKSKETSIKIYEDLYKEGLVNIQQNNEMFLGTFFRMLYRIIILIDNSEFDEKKKKFYTGIVRSQLSNYQLVIFFYNCQSEYGRNFQSLIKKYNLLKHCPEGLIELDIDKQILKELQTNSDSTNSGTTL